MPARTSPLVLSSILSSVIVLSADTPRAQYAEVGATGLLSIPGRSAGDLFGWRVRALGDVNGDLVPDFAVAAPFHQLNIGRVSVHSGANGAELWGRNGGGTSAILGFDMAVLRDLDNDGAREVVGGAPFQGGGVVQVWSGRTGTVLRTLTAPGGGVFFGGSVATGGDYDGDGIDDLAIADDGSSASGAQRGQVFVFSTATFALVRQIAPPSGAFLFGTTLAFVGDTDGDGRDELAIGDRLGTTGSAGRLHLVGFDGQVDVVRWTVGGFDYGTDIDGNKLDGGGDVDGDGVPDVIVDESSVHRARLLSGANGAVLATLRGAGADRFGKGAKIVDDQNHDGVPDLLIGANNDSTVAHWNGRVRLISGRDRRLLTIVTNTTADALFGNDVDLIGDVNGDGWNDLLLGASGSSGFTRTMGGVRIVAGDPVLAGWQVYGAGTPGTLGVPTLLLDVDPQLGVPFTLQFATQLPVASAGLFVLGFREVALPTTFGVTLLADPVVLSPFVIAANGFALPLTLADPQLLGVAAHAQVLQLDPAAIGGVAATRGLRATFGR